MVSNFLLATLGLVWLAPVSVGKSRPACHRLATDGAVFPWPRERTDTMTRRNQQTKDELIADLRAQLEERDQGTFPDRLHIGTNLKEGKTGIRYTVATVVWSSTFNGLPIQSTMDVGSRITGTNPRDALLALLRADDDERQDAITCIEAAASASKAERS